mmetsp:Transcript_46966/g.102151  ORF Transcript_46966/g.102151 Transcript_46966/m.102151 type:complete len:331 (+) Transcript_46966:44-1036(+)|eukprot:CAMPEP_0204270810 /NCGR_PEP_ID=MMETSP0468-20130131/19104_1 /ASSEMBLY_ACC=CAM_ASM_000383 /TAXON_ID=2969 /ORGANISM="Oxyrrhis marina" /LENGTH=330 /DNA_ID=CAMNT_0051246387 /DNA_START=30 /DNA_END=1022 /DNA_ORIENTATION=-
MATASTSRARAWYLGTEEGVDPKGTPHVVFILEIKMASAELRITRRYSDLRKCQTALMLEFCSQPFAIPPMPSRRPSGSWFFDMKKETHVRTRGTELAAWLETILNLPDRGSVVGWPPFHSHLGLNDDGKRIFLSEASRRKREVAGWTTDASASAPAPRGVGFGLWDDVDAVVARSGDEGGARSEQESLDTGVSLIAAAGRAAPSEIEGVLAALWQLPKPAREGALAQCGFAQVAAAFTRLTDALRKNDFDPFDDGVESAVVHAIRLSNLWWQTSEDTQVAAEALRGLLEVAVRLRPETFDTVYQQVVERARARFPQVAEVLLDIRTSVG